MQATGVANRRSAMIDATIKLPFIMGAIAQRPLYAASHPQRFFQGHGEGHAGDQGEHRGHPGET